MPINQLVIWYNDRRFCIRESAINTLAVIKKRRVILITLLLLAIPLRLFWYMYARPLPSKDFSQHKKIAEDLVKHGQFGYPDLTTKQLPLYPLILSLIMKFTPTTVNPVFVNIILSSMMIFFIYLFADNLLKKNKKIALIAAIITALNPSFIIYSIAGAAENLFIISLLISFISIISINSTNNWTKLISGSIFFGLSLLTHAESVFYFVIIIVMILISRTGKKQKLKFVFSLLLITGITLSPWVARNFIRFQNILLTSQNGLTFYKAHTQGNSDLPLQDSTNINGIDGIKNNIRGFKLGMSAIINDPKKYINDIGRGSKELYSFSGNSLIETVKFEKQSPMGNKDTVLKTAVSLSVLFSFRIILFLAIVSLLFIRRYSPRTWVILWGIIITNWICYCVVFSAESRFRFTAEVGFCILAAISLYEAALLSRKLLRKKQRIQPVEQKQDFEGDMESVIQPGVDNSETISLTDSDQENDQDD